MTATCPKCRAPLVVASGVASVAHKPECPEARVKYLLRQGAPKNMDLGERKRGGKAEAALYRMLADLGFCDLGALSREDADLYLAGAVWVRQYPWGAYLDPPRLFAADAGFPVDRVLIESHGMAHAAGCGKVKKDIERQGLAAANGWRVLTLSPGSIMDGSAVDLIRAALTAPRRDGGSK